MKKIFLFFILACLAAGIVLAQDFTVFTAEGRVQKGTGYEKEEIVSGEILSGDTIVSISAGAVLVLKEGERTFTIKPGYIGRIVSFPPILRAIRRGLIVADNAENDPLHNALRAGAAAAGEEIIEEDPPLEVLYIREPLEYRATDEEGHVRVFRIEQDLNVRAARDAHEAGKK